ncbi:MAG: hypothetical protein RBR88_06105 [Candidatus Saccharicenans sp.]|nr:hypothetical protein [Candidatus Saccharicenans sp.]
MKRTLGIEQYLFLTLCLIILIYPSVYGQQKQLPENNDFYDNEPFKNLAVLPIEITGEVANPGPVDLSRLALHQVQVREARMSEEGTAFIGAYVYQGYSLFDILRDQILNKKNQEQFSSPIDLIVTIENKRGERAIFSWGEIFYPNILHRIIIATRVAPIIPSTTGETWPLPDESKVVAANDLISERNLQSPAKIIVSSSPVSMSVDKGKKPLYSEKISLIKNGKDAGVLNKLPIAQPELTYPAVFFGRGKGFHGVRTFSGISLKSVLEEFVDVDKNSLRKGYLVITGADGYRAVFSISEIFNRNDFKEILIYEQKEKEGGKFAIFAAPDFFSDRAVKALKAIYF